VSNEDEASGAVQQSIANHKEAASTMTIALTPARFQRRGKKISLNSHN
jgi:hypothetical protein